MAELTDLIKDAEHIKAQNVGIVFRQSNPFFNAVTLDEVYASLDFSDSPADIDLPGCSWQVPLKEIPAITIKMGNMAVEKGQTVN